MFTTGFDECSQQAFMSVHNGRGFPHFRFTLTPVVCQLRCFSRALAGLYFDRFIGQKLAVVAEIQIACAETR